MLSSHTAELSRIVGAKAVVTGGLGFIGSNLVHALSQAGAAVHVLDALVPHHGGDLRNLDGIEPAGLLVAPFDDPRVERFVAGAEFVFNVAGQVSHHASMVDPLTDLELNVRSHVVLLETLRRVAPGCRIVLTSTRQVYGRPVRLPVDEEHPTNPVDVNGVDKLAGEQFHLLYGTVHGLRPTVLRLTNVYGPRQNLTKPGLGALPVFIRRALSGETIELFGSGEQLRDCLHVDDVVAALVASTADAAIGEIVNLGHQRSWTLREIVGEIIELSDSTSELRYVAWPPELASIDIGDFQGDWSKAAVLLGWKPAVRLTDGLRSTIDFYRKNPWYLSST